MNVFTEAIRLITHPPGDLVYFLVTLFALQQAFYPVLSARRKKASLSRWGWCIGVLLMSRIILIVVALLSNVDLVVPAELLPPLERWLGFVGIMLVMWAALFNKRAARWQTFVFVVLLAVSLVGYGYSAVVWPSQISMNPSYNYSIQAQVWDIASLCFLMLAILLTFILRPYEWEWASGLFLFWLLGYGAQLLWPDAQIHVPGWQRLASLVTYPLLTGLVHKQAPVVSRRPLSRDRLPDGDALLKLVRGVESARELEPSLIIASSRLARLLHAEMCAIALTTEEDETQLRVVALHPPNAAQLEAPELEWGAYSILQQAYATQQPKFIQPVEDFSWLPPLYKRLGFQKAGPMAILPLANENKMLGLLLLGNPESDRLWAPQSLSGFKLVATLLAGAITQARAQGKDVSLLDRIRGQDDGRQKLEAKLEQTRQEVDSRNQRIDALNQQIQAHEQEILHLNRELESRDGQVSETELSFWQNEVRELSQDREMLLDDRNRIAEQLSTMKLKLDSEIETRNKFQAQLRETQAKLDELKKDLADVQRGTAVGLVVVDENGQIVTSDALARRMLHLPQGDVTGMPIDGAYPDPTWAKSINELLSRKADAKRRAHLTLKEFEGIIDADLVTLAGRDGVPDGLVITLHAPESAVERQEAIVSIANEFRTPMTAITGYTDLLLGEQAGILTEMQQQFLERVKANVEQLGHLLNDLIRVTSPDSRPIELSPQLINLIEIIEEAIMGLAARFRERKLAVRLDLPPELSMVRADRDSLYQIMLRLLSNAALCSEQGSEVIVRATQEKAERDDEAYITISVVDTGGGIAPEDYPRVFRRFYRANQPLIDGMGETGIGMAVAKALVEANGGRIWVDSQPGIGSTFSFVLKVDDFQQPTPRTATASAT